MEKVPYFFSGRITSAINLPSSAMVMDNTSKSATVLCKMTNSSYGLVSGNATYGAIYSSGAYLYRVDTAAGTATPILNWINCNIDSDTISGVACLDDGRIACVSNNYNDKTGESTPELALLTKTKATEASKKKVLTLAAQYIDSNLKTEVLSFNKTNPDYRIEVTDYSQYNTESDYDAGLKKMTTDILAGSVPDILYTQGINVEQFVTKGVITDLDQFLAKDKTVTKDSIMVEQPLILLNNTDKQPLSIFLSQINTGEIGLAFAMATVYMIPSLLLFLHGEEYLVEGIANSGSVKG